MGTDAIPNIGYTQPNDETQFKILFQGMAKEGKRGTRLPSAQAKKLRNVLRRNLELLMDRDYPTDKFRNKSERQMEVAKDIGVSWSSIQRALDPSRGITTTPSEPSAIDLT
jgi:hypothetical protein